MPRGEKPGQNVGSRAGKFKKGGVYFGAFFVVPFFFCGWLVSAKTVPLLQTVSGKIEDC